MKLSILFFLFCFFNVNSLGFTKAKKHSLTKLKTFESIDFETRTYSIINKTNALTKTMRANNVLSTALLCFTGGFIINPAKLRSVEFFASTFITVLVMSNSMIINDIFDMKVDRINNPTRPLVKGELSRTEVIVASFLFFAISEFLNIKYIPKSVQIFPHIANLLSVIYTPILKKIPYLKNITCAFLIASSFSFSALSIQPYFIFNKNMALLMILSSMLFVGSWTIEILSDIVDKDGDKQNNILTLPILHGNEYSINFSKRIYINVLVINAIILSKLYTFNTGFAFMFINMQFLNNLDEIKKYNYAVDTIKHASNSSLKTVFLNILYMCILRTIPNII
jgi:4-hydroxybenzoate polyprenyltransferase